MRGEQTGVGTDASRTGDRFQTRGVTEMQAGKLETSPPRFWTTAYGVINTVDDDNLVTRSLGAMGEWAESEVDLLGGLLQEGATVVEIGSEYGAHALCLAQIVGDSGEVHVLESDRMVHLQLCANAAINRVPNIHAHLSPKDGKRGGGLKALDLEALHLLKVNTEGAMSALLADAKDLILEHKPYLYFRLGSPKQSRAEVDAVRGLGYRCWSHVAYLDGGDEKGSGGTKYFPGWAHLNVIAAPIEAGAEVDFSHLREI